MSDDDRAIKTRKMTCPRCFAEVNIDPREVFDALYNKSYGWVCKDCDVELTKAAMKSIQKVFGNKKE